MLKIGVVGFSGRVNSIVIEEILHNQNCSLSGIFVRKEKINQTFSSPLYDNITELAKNSQAIIDFSTPYNSLSIAKQLRNNPCLLVSGTTGFTSKEFDEFKSYSKFFPIIWSANMSVGINLLHKLLKLATQTLGSDFNSAIIDIHHKHKKDSPSGTAISLAHTIQNAAKAAAQPQIASLRLGEEFGSHEIIFSGADESITLSHKSFNRKSYAKGAIRACFWGQDKTQGFYSMEDVY